MLSNKNITQQKFNRQKFLQTKISRSTVADVFCPKVSCCGHGTGDTVAMVRYENEFRVQCSCVTVKRIALIVMYVSWKTNFVTNNL